MNPTCEFEYEAWGPHPGCREFMDGPEAVFPCGEPAVMRFHIICHTPEGDEPGTLLACATHVREIGPDDMYTTTTRSEPIVRVHWRPVVHWVA